MKALVDITCTDGRSTNGSMVQCRIETEDDDDAQALGLAICCALAGTTVARQLNTLAHAVRYLSDMYPDSVEGATVEEDKFAEAAFAVVGWWDKHDKEMEALHEPSK